MDGRWALALSIGERALIALVMGRVGGLPWTHEAQIIPRWFSVGSRGWIEANGLADISVHGCGEGTPRYVELFDRQASSLDAHNFGMFVGGGAWGMPNGAGGGACIGGVPYGRAPYPNHPGPFRLKDGGSLLSPWLLPDVPAEPARCVRDVRMS